MSARPRTDRISRALGAEAGFTLIEVLVAMTVLALLFAVLFGSLRLGNRYQASAARTTEQAAEFQTAHRLLRRLLTRAYPLTYETGEQDRFAFEGTPGAVRFVAIMASYPGQPGPNLFSFEFSDTGEGTELRVKRRTFRPRDDTFDLGAIEEDIILVAGPISGEFAFFGSDDGDTPGTWRGTWSGAERLPDLVRLSITTPSAAGARWPELIIPVAITMDIACMRTGEEDLEFEEEPSGKCRLGEDDRP